MTLSVQFMTMLAMIGMGSLFGAMFDTYNRFLKRTKRKHWIVFINDILFWILQGLIIFYVLFLVNRGALRFYIFIALLCGFAAYQSLLKKAYLAVLEAVISAVVHTCEFLAKAFHILVYRPLLFLFTVIASAFIMAGRGLLALVRFLLNVLLWIMKFFWKPFKGLFSLFWKLVPKRIKVFLEMSYNKVAGILRYLQNMSKKWRNKNKK